MTVARVLVFLITFSILKNMRNFVALSIFAFHFICQRRMRSHRRRRLGTTLICVEIHDISSNSSFRPHRHYPRPFVIINSIPRFRKPRRLHQAATLIWNDVPASLPHFHSAQATAHIHRFTQCWLFSIFNLLCNLFFIYFLQFFLTIKGKKLVLRRAIGVISCIGMQHL